MPDNFREFLTIGDAAALIGVSIDTLRNWDRAGKLRAARHPINGYRLYRREDLAALLSATAGGAAARPPAMDGGPATVEHP